MDVRFRPVANAMAAGSCPACRAIATKTYRAREAPLMPLPECPHPDQCSGHYRIDTDSLWHEEPALPVKYHGRDALGPRERRPSLLTRLKRLLYL